MSSSNTRGTTGRLTDSPNRLVAAIFGVVYLLVGIIGFLVTGFEDFADNNTNEKILGIFEVNGLHNVVHLLIGAVLLAASRTVAAAKASNMFVGAVYLIVGIIGLFIANDTSDLNILSLNGADNVLHLASALVLLGVALSQDKDTARGDVPGVPGV
jgi:glucose uptake protein GlcU